MPRIRGPLLDSSLRMELRFEDGRLLVHPDFRADASTSAHGDDTVEFVEDGRVDDIAMALLRLAVASLLHA